MASFPFECPYCRRRLAVFERLLGKRVRCPNCFEFVTLTPMRMGELPQPLTDFPDAATGEHPPRDREFDF